MSIYCILLVRAVAAQPRDVALAPASAASVG